LALHRESSRQASHYDQIIADYDLHYYDRNSVAYRERFIIDPLVAGLDMRGWKVADLASGSGHTSLSLMKRFPGVEMTGFDISPSACKRYEEMAGRPSRVLDLTRGYDGSEIFDAAIIMGGLHHCITDLEATLTTIGSMLKPGAPFLMFEPNRHYILQSVRRLWYRLDKYFDATTEDALSHEDLLARAKGIFLAERLSYFGGPAFFFVYNSLVFRLPPRAKETISRPLLELECLFNRLPGRLIYPSFLARWRRL
jgi:SAM-dependent methyltransferase